MFCGQAEKAFAAEAAVVSKTQKVERVGPAIGSPGVLTIETDKTDRPGLLWVKTQSELRKAFKKHPCKGMGDVLILNHEDKGIRITHQTAVSTNVALCPFGGPEKKLNFSGSVLVLGVGDIISLGRVPVVPGHPNGRVSG